MNRTINPDLILRQKDIDAARRLAEQLVQRARMVECSLHELDHGIGGADLHRQLLLNYSTEIVETARDLGAQLQVFSGNQMEVQEELPSVHDWMFLDMAGQLADFAAINQMSGLYAGDGGGVCVFAHGETGRLLTDQALNLDLQFVNDTKANDYPVSEDPRR